MAKAAYYAKTLNGAQVRVRQLLRIVDSYENNALRREAENKRLREAIEWALGVRGYFSTRDAGTGQYYWRKELQKRAGISDEELTKMAMRPAAD